MKALTSTNMLNKQCSAWLCCLSSELTLSLKRVIDLTFQICLTKTNKFV